MVSTVQKQKPIRTCTKTYKNYGSFKKYIVEDFNNRCGYCDDLDKFNGGKNNYQIDHLKPKKLFSELETDYINLVYSCPFCNRAKWDKWKKKDGFIDPCDEEYDNHLERNSRGQIKCKSEQGKYIHTNLNLHLKRHELLWLIEKIIQQKEELISFKKALEKTHPKYVEIIERYIECDERLIEYTNLFYSEI
jgi:hypothetical protein